MTDSFESTMQGLTDDELVLIAHGDTDDYEQAAMAAARNEIARRGLAEDFVTTALEHEELRDRAEALRPDLPLSTLARIVLIVIGPFSFWPAIILGARGYRRKSREAWICLLIGIAFQWGVIGLLFVIFDVM
ncbi:hypothetical protein [Novosphingobium colocasiae]|uniref:Uncharacterized protein n=1 Tax=Novosphingobium colocasiae TaxID=1256513 RepID=A0A918PA64_9SPHN|nr:hypothetical protein [Novosphingobium colocasiae]GGY95284.1 hypothetical protein GCM10011614_07480 [Novosphingobium colocasiae]